MTKTSVPRVVLVLAAFFSSIAVAFGWSFNVESSVDVGQAGRWAVLADGGWAKASGGQLQFFSSSGDRLQSFGLRGNQLLVAPFGGHVLGVITYVDPQPKTLDAIAFDLYSAEGQRLAHIDKPPFVSAIVSGAGGAFVGIDGAEGLPGAILRFYDARGNGQDTLMVDRFEGGKFSRDGSRFLFETAREGLQVATAKGVRQAELGVTERWAASADAHVIVTVLAGEFRCYRDGKFHQSMPRQDGGLPIRALSVSPDGQHACAATARHAILFQTDTVATLWDVAVPDTTWNIRTVDVLDGARLVALGLDYDPGPESLERHVRSRCVIYDRTGQVVHTEEETPSKWGAAFPEVRFEPGRGRLVFINRDRFKSMHVDSL